MAPAALQELLIQDLKTEDPTQPGGYALRRVGRGSVVLVRGEDPDGETVTWVALVNKVGSGGRQRGRELGGREEGRWLVATPSGCGRGGGTVGRASAGYRPARCRQAGRQAGMLPTCPGDAA
jgi:hypothetical protein